MAKSKQEDDGYTEAWEAYKKTDAYKKATQILEKVKADQLDEILQGAFNAGWSLLLTTFIQDIVKNEKKWFKPKLTGQAQ